MISSLWPFRIARRTLPAELAQAVKRWRGLPDYDSERPPAMGRWVVVDVESSGPDAVNDRLIAVGALAIVDGQIDLSDSFEVILRQDAPSPADNIEVHGIGGTEQALGMDPREALAAFLDFAGKDPLVAFHAPFDATMLRRAFDLHLGIAFRRPWMDLADIACLAWPKYASRLSGLDDWLEAFSIPVAFRHRAIADCLATAQLMLMALPEAAGIGASTSGKLVSLSRADRWLS
ncbi:MAG TPA: 3'-5' exonuclease [Usitatibacteraceae bacterium]|nr:3'-5' exonuclease [Usitatibacteraceae bacterium]